MVPVFNISTTKYTGYRAEETPLEKLVLGNQSVLYGQPDNESMSPDGLRKPEFQVILAFHRGNRVSFFKHALEGTWGNTIDLKRSVSR